MLNKDECRIGSLDQIKLGIEIPVLPKKTTDVTEERNGWYVKGPIPGAWISKAAQLSGDHTLHVALAIQYVRGLYEVESKEKCNIIAIKRFHFDRFGVKKDSTRRALERLQEAGLIKYTKDGQKFKVTILPVEP